MQECALYCTGCAFVTDATQQCQEKGCLSGPNKELNRLAKLSITDFPLIENKNYHADLNGDHQNLLKQQNSVLVVRRHKIIDLANDLDAEILSQHPSIVDITFARNFFIQFNSNSASKMIHLNGVDVNQGSENGGPVNFMKAVYMSHSGYYKFFSQKASKVGKDGVFQGEAERRQKLIRTIESYELGVTTDDNSPTDAKGDNTREQSSMSKIEEEKQTTIILLGSAIRRVNRGKGNQKLIWLKRLFGPRCQSVVSGEVGKEPDTKRDKGDNVSDYIHYALVRLKDEREMLRVLNDCQYHYLINEHLNLMPLLTFLTTPLEKCPSPEKRSNISLKKNQRGSLKKPSEKSANSKKRELSSPQSQSSLPLAFVKKLTSMTDNIGQHLNLDSQEQKSIQRPSNPNRIEGLVNNVNSDLEIKSSYSVPTTICATDKPRPNKKVSTDISNFTDADMLDFDKLLNEVRKIHHVESGDEASDDEDDTESRLIIDNDQADYHSSNDDNTELQVDGKVLIGKEATTIGGSTVKNQQMKATSSISDEQSKSTMSLLHERGCETLGEGSKTSFEIPGKQNSCVDMPNRKSEDISKTNSEGRQAGKDEMIDNKNQSQLLLKKCYVDIPPLNTEKLGLHGSNTAIKDEDSTTKIKSKDESRMSKLTDKHQDGIAPASENGGNCSLQEKCHHEGDKQQICEEKVEVESPPERNLAISNQNSNDVLLKRIDSLEKMVKEWRGIFKTTKEQAIQSESKWKLLEAQYKKQLSDVKNVFLPEHDEKEAEDEDLSKLLKTHLEQTERKHSLLMKQSESALQEKWINANRKDKEEERIKGNTLRDEQLQEVKKNYAKDLAELNLKLQEEGNVHRKEQEKMEMERRKFIEVDEEARKNHRKQLEQMENKFKNDLFESNAKWKTVVEESIASHQKKEELWGKDQENARMQLSSIQKDFNTCRKSYEDVKKALDACICKKNANKSFATKLSQTDQFDAVNEEIMTLRVKIDMLEKDKRLIHEQHEMKLKEKDDETAKAIAVQATLNKTIDKHKQQFALCQINLEVTSKELELANAKIAATADGANVESIALNFEDSVEYKKLKQDHTDQIKELVQKNVLKMATLNKKLTETKRENEELKSFLEEEKTSNEQQLENQKNYTRQFENEVKDLKCKLSKTVVERDTMATNVQQFKQTLNSSSNSEEQLKSEIEQLTKALNEEKAKTEEMNDKLKEKDMNASRDLKTQAAMFEGDVAKLKGQIVVHNLEATQREEELQKLKADISTKQSKIENMANQREKQNKAMERWSNERGVVENVILQTLPKTLDSLQEMKHSIPNSNTWPSKEALQRLDYKEKIKAIQGILICTAGYFRTLKNDADANMNKIDEDVAREVELSRKFLAQEQEKYQIKVEENNTLSKKFSQLEHSNKELQEQLKVAEESLSESNVKTKSEIDGKDKEIAKLVKKHNQAQLESGKEIEQVNIFT